MDPATIVRRDELGALRAEDRGEGAELGGRGDARGVADVLEYATPEPRSTSEEDDESDASHLGPGRLRMRRLDRPDRL